MQHLHFPFLSFYPCFPSQHQHSIYWTLQIPLPLLLCLFPNLTMHLAVKPFPN
uniref:Uncharacterized protein n=1 Tax=Rhizophora mucronata TaxID=61149 RepID=A0A2P2P0B7_RHIMU